MRYADIFFGEIRSQCEVENVIELAAVHKDVHHIIQILLIPVVIGVWPAHLPIIKVKCI